MLIFPHSCGEIFNVLPKQPRKAAGSRPAGPGRDHRYSAQSQQAAIDAVSHQAQSLILISACAHVMCPARFTVPPQKDFPALQLPFFLFFSAENVPFSSSITSIALSFVALLYVYSARTFYYPNDVIAWSFSSVFISCFEGNVRLKTLKRTR